MTRTNEEEDLVFKYSAIRASSNGQESPTRIHCRYGSPSLRKLYIFIPRYFPLSDCIAGCSRRYASSLAHVNFIANFAWQKSISSGKKNFKNY